jgi:hypothetical protein
MRYFHEMFLNSFSMRGTPRYFKGRAPFRKNMIHTIVLGNQLSVNLEDEERCVMINHGFKG